MSSIPRVGQAVIHNPNRHTLSILPVSIPHPRLDEGEEHLVAVRAVGLTRTELDWPKLPARGLLVPGFDVSGVVAQAPDNSPLPIGSSIYARLGEEPWYDNGGARTYTIVKLSQMAKIPSNLTFEQAATVPISALTAWQALFVHAGLNTPVTSEMDCNATPSTRILVNGASGAVGIFAIQLARLAGVHVVATCGASNVGFLRSLGANEVLDYREDDICEWFLRAQEERGFDVVLDCVGGLSLRNAWKTIKDGGIVISVVQEPTEQRPTSLVAQKVRSRYFIVEADRPQLETITEFIEAGHLTVVLERAFEMWDYEMAFEYARKGYGRGKIVLKITEESVEKANGTVRKPNSSNRALHA